MLSRNSDNAEEAIAKIKAEANPHGPIPDITFFSCDLGSLERVKLVGDQVREVSLAPGHAAWLPAQTHAGENIGTSETHVMFIELKEPGQAGGETALGPQTD